MSADIDAYQDQLVAWRRHLHQHPEASFEEHETVRYIRAELEPRLPGLKEQYPDDDIDTLLLRANIPGNNVDEMRRFVAEGRAGQGEGVPGGELTKLVQKIYETTTSGEFHLKTDDLEINLTKKGEQ